MGERKHPLAKCEECPLYEGGTYVPSTGPDEAKLAIVGEAPGFQETVYGKSFVGPSGKLLDKVLEYHKIERNEAFLTNACLCRPPGNATPTRAAIDACRPRLLVELRGRNVEQVLALGNTAAESLLHKSGITKLRVGPGHRSPDLPDVRVVPSLHPAACLRQGDQFPHLVTDVGKLRYTPHVWSEPEIVVANNRVDALRWLSHIASTVPEGTGILVIDDEVDIEKDASFGNPSQHSMLCVGIGYAPNKVLVLAEDIVGEKEVWDVLGELLRTRLIVAQNGKFDLKGLYKYVGGLKLYGDTMLASYVFDERPGVHGLKYQAIEYLGAPAYDEEIKRYVGPGDGYGVIPRDILYRYNGYDVACTYALWLMWSLRFEQGNEDLRRKHDDLVEASNELMYVELNGITVDRTYLSELDKEYRERLVKLEDEIDLVVTNQYDKAGGINPRSPMQVKKFLADNRIEVDSTNEDTLRILLKALEEGRVERPKEVKEFVQLLLTHRREAKLHGTYVKGIAKRLYRGRVYSTYLLHGSTTGRLASRDPNLQNIPRESSIRRIFVPSRPSRVFLQSDYAQAELRVLSYLAGDTYFRDIFNAGDRDVFDDLSEILYPFESVLYKAGEITDAHWKELRIRVKAFVYGLGYGREAPSIAKEFNLPMEEAFRLKREFFEVIPEIVAFQEETKAKVRAGDDLITPWGRHRRFHLITKENEKTTMNEALAFLPQSTASDMCVKALVWTRQETKGFAWIRNIVHDSLLVECEEEDVEEVKEITERNMLKAAELVVGDYVKFKVDTKVGKNWGEV